MSEHEREGSVQRSQDGLLRKKLSRRRMLQATGAAAGALALGGLDGASRAAAATAGTATRTVPVALKRTMADLKHVVIMMQENRGYDHYFGALTLAGSCGFGDKQAVRAQNGQTVFFMPDGSINPGAITTLPWRLDCTKIDGQQAPQNRGAGAVAYYAAEDIPWQHALANSYTVCDHYHCALATSTSPNRIMMWTGTNDPDGDHGGPAVNNNGDYQYGYTWETYPEILQEAGVSWQVYVNNDEELPTYWVGDGTDNTLRSFAAFNPANANAENSVPGQGLLARANVLQTETTTPADVHLDRSDLNYVLKEFIADCAAGTLPEVSWVVAPGAWCEHPGFTPNDGAVYVNRVITALHDNPDLWNSTLLIVIYDENGDRADHVLNPVPEPGTPGESGAGLMAAGLWMRVPAVLISPWTRGGWVASETFDHTSLIQFLEKWTTFMGKPALCPNISAWRRSICGDLTSAIDFSSFDNSLPELPTPASLDAAEDFIATLPSWTTLEPAPGQQQTFPAQPVQGPLQLRSTPYRQHATISVDRTTGTVTATMTNLSSNAASMQVFPDAFLPFAATPNTVSLATGPKTYAWDSTKTAARYAFSIYGPDHFVRSFAGTVIPASEDGGQVPQVDAKLGTGNTPTLKITLSNGGRTPVQFTLTPNDYSGAQQTITVGFGKHVMVDWSTNQYGYYDVAVTANTNDGFTQRFAGRIS